MSGRAWRSSSRHLFSSSKSRFKKCCACSVLLVYVEQRVFSVCHALPMIPDRCLFTWFLCVVLLVNWLSGELHFIALLFAVHCCSLQKVYLNGNKLSEVPELWSQLPQLKVSVAGRGVRMWIIDVLCVAGGGGWGALSLSLDIPLDILLLLMMMIYSFNQ